MCWRTLTGFFLCSLHKDYTTQSRKKQVYAMPKITTQHSCCFCRTLYSTLFVFQSPQRYYPIPRQDLRSPSGTPSFVPAFLPENALWERSSFPGMKNPPFRFAPFAPRRLFLLCCARRPNYADIDTRTKVPLRQPEQGEAASGITLTPSRTRHKGFICVHRRKGIDTLRAHRQGCKRPSCASEAHKKAVRPKKSEPPFFSVRKPRKRLF